jgi:hypothetical protein
MVPRKPGLEEAAQGSDGAPRESPFAALAGLKRQQ